MELSPFLLLLCCFHLISLCYSQEFSEASPQTLAAETSTATQNSQWDTTYTAAQPTALDARTGPAPVTSRSTQAEYSTLVNNYRGPMMMPMRNPYGLRVGRHNEERKERLNSKQFEAEIDNLAENSDRYSDPTEAFKYPYQLPYIYPQPYVESEIPEISQQSNLPTQFSEVNENNASASTQNYYGVPPNGYSGNVPMPFNNYPYNPFMNTQFLGRSPSNDLLYAQLMGRELYPNPAYILNRGGMRQPGLPTAFARPPLNDREAEELAKELVTPAETIDTSRARIAPGLFPPRSMAPYAPFPFGIPPPLQPAVLPPVQFAPRAVPPVVQPPPILPAEQVVDEALLPKPVPIFPEEKPAVIDIAEPRTMEGIPPVFPQANENVVPESPNPYDFGYQSNDGLGTDQHRQESADENGRVTGSYSFRLPDGTYRFAEYVADHLGFRVVIRSNEQGVANPGSANAAVVAEPPTRPVLIESLRRSGISAVEVPAVPSDIEVETE